MNGERHSQRRDILREIGAVTLKTPCDPGANSDKRAFGAFGTDLPALPEGDRDYIPRVAVPLRGLRLLEPPTGFGAWAEAEGLPRAAVVEAGGRVLIVSDSADLFSGPRRSSAAYVYVIGVAPADWPVPPRREAANKRRQRPAQKRR